MADDNGGFWSSLGASLGQGLRTAGGILDPTVANQLENEYTQKMAYQNRQKEMLMGNIISGIQNGSIAKEQGAVALQRMGIDPSVIGAIGPTPEAQANQQFIKWMQGQQQPQAIPQPQTPGMAPPAMAPAQQPQMIGGIPASAAMSPLGMKYMQAQMEQRKLSQPIKVDFDRDNGAIIKTYADGRVETQQIPDWKGKQSAFAKELKDAGMKEGTPEWESAFRKRIARETAPTSTMVNISTGGVGGKNLKQDVVDYYASQSLAGDNSWQVGLARGKVGQQLISAVKDRIPELAKERGVSPTEASAMKGQRDALNASLKDRQKFVAAGSQYINNFNQQADLVDKYMEKGVAGGTPAINRWVQAGRKAIAGDPDVTALDTAIRGLAREHQRIVTGVTSNAQLHVSAQQTADELLNRDMSPAQIRATLQVMREEAKNALDSGRGEVDLLTTQLKSLGSPQTKTEIKQGIPEGWTVKVK